MTSPPTSVDRDITGYGISDLRPRRFGIINAHAGAGVRLKSLVSRCESQDEVRHEGTSVNPSGHVALVSGKHRRTLRARGECFVQGEISPTPESIIEEIAFNGWPNYARAKDVTEFEAAEKADVIFGVHDEVA